MASFLYNSAIKDAFLGRIVVGVSTFKAMLTTSSYVENQDTHTTRANITSEVAGTGYVAGGIVCVPTISQDLTTNQTKIVFPSLTWNNAVISDVRKVVYYVGNGGSASSDYLIALNDLGANYSANSNSLIIASCELQITTP